MAKDPLDLWNEEVPETTALALKELALAATAEAHGLAVREFPGFPISHIAGQLRFTKMQYKMLEFGKIDPVLTSRARFHPNALAFAQLYNPRLHITSATIDSAQGCPQLSLLREIEQAEQLQFLNERGVLVCHLCVWVEGDLSKPKLTHIKFPDGRGGYLEPYVDLAQITRRAPILRVENVRDDHGVRERGADTKINRDDA